MRQQLTEPPGVLYREHGSNSLKSEPSLKSHGSLGSIPQEIFQQSRQKSTTVTAVPPRGNQAELRYNYVFLE